MRNIFCHLTVAPASCKLRDRFAPKRSRVACFTMSTVYAPAFPAFGSHIPHCEPAWYQGFRSPYYRASHAAFRATVRAFVEQEIKPNIDVGRQREGHARAGGAGGGKARGGRHQSALRRPRPRRRVREMREGSRQVNNILASDIRNEASTTSGEAEKRREDQGRSP